MTEATERVLATIKRLIRLKGYSPTVREIADELGLASTATVQVQIDRLVEAGIVTKEATSPRTLQIVEGKRGRAS